MSDRLLSASASIFTLWAYSLGLGRGGEYEVLNAVAAHNVEEVEGADKVVAVVLQGLADALANSLETCKMHNGFDVGILLKNSFGCCLIAQLGIDKGDSFAGDLLDADKGFLAGIAEIVNNDYVVAGLDELDAGVAADISGAAGDKNGHKLIFLSKTRSMFCSNFYIIYDLTQKANS